MRRIFALPLGQQCGVEHPRFHFVGCVMRRFLPFFVLVLAAFGFAAPASAAISVRVDLSSQTMAVTTSDGESHVWKISSGRDGYRTIRGNFRPQRLAKHWYSRKYGGAMPNAVFFRGGFAIHGTSAVGRLGRPASHGCVRLHPANAAKFFALVQKHGMGATNIAIHGSPTDSPTRYAKAGGKSRAAVAAAKRQGEARMAARRAAPDWQTARGQILLKPSLPPSALGFHPIYDQGR